jgi:hypothetical protein
MSGLSSFPTTLNSWSAKTNNVDDVMAEHVNLLQNAVADLEAKIGIDSSLVNTTIDYFLKNASGAYRTHNHDGASNDGANIPGSSLASLASISSGAGIIPVANIDVGTTANKILQLNASAQIPAVSGALVTGVAHTTGTETIAGLKTLSSKTIMAGFTLSAACDFAQYQAVSLVVENRSGSDPTTPTTGQIWLRTDL